MARAALLSVTVPTVVPVLGLWQGGGGGPSPQPAPHHKAQADLLYLYPPTHAGMLTITDFILVLHRYYRSPLVRSGLGVWGHPPGLGQREFRQPDDQWAHI